MNPSELPTPQSIDPTAPFDPVKAKSSVDPVEPKVEQKPEVVQTSSLPEVPVLPAAPISKELPPVPAHESTTGKEIVSEIAGKEKSAVLNDIVRLNEELRKVFIGQNALVEQVIIALVCGGHVLIEGQPGLGKTHLVVSLAKAIEGAFKRIQFTPDLMPSDVTGHSMFDMASQTFSIKKGPVFTNLLLADEINRAPAKTQAALLEVMQEKQVTIDGEALPVPLPFMVLATQNPVEHDGTHPLPEAQLDRFMMKILVEAPTLEEEIEITNRVTSPTQPSLDIDQVESIFSPEKILQLQKDIEGTKTADSLVQYAVEIVQSTRTSPMISLGASPRASISLIKAAKGYALMRDRDFVMPDDVKVVALPVLRHRVELSPEVAITGQTVDDTLMTLINSIEAPRS